MRRYLSFCFLSLAYCNSYGLVEKLEFSDHASGGLVRDGLFALWHMNGNVNDAWDNGTGLQHGTTVVNTYIADRYGRQNHAINIATPAVIDFAHLDTYATAPMSACFWFLIQSGTAINSFIFYSGTGYSIQVGTPTLFLGAGGFTHNAAANAGSGVWHYICVAIDAQVVLYNGPFGGELVQSSPVDHALTLPSAATPLEIGVNAATSAAFDDVVFYTRKLSFAEAKQNFQAATQQ